MIFDKAMTEGYSSANVQGRMEGRRALRWRRRLRKWGGECESEEASTHAIAPTSGPLCLYAPPPEWRSLPDWLYSLGVPVPHLEDMVSNRLVSEDHRQNEGL